MAKRYTKQQREDAATICAMVASTPGHAYPDAADALGISQRGYAIALASAAWSQCNYTLANDHESDAEAEAEAMIRTGWSPR